MTLRKGGGRFAIGLNQDRLQPSGRTISDEETAMRRYLWMSVAVELAMLAMFAGEPLSQRLKSDWKVLTF